MLQCWKAEGWAWRNLRTTRALLASIGKKNLPIRLRSCNTDNCYVSIPMHSWSCGRLAWSFECSLGKIVELKAREWRALPLFGLGIVHNYMQYRKDSTWIYPLAKYPPCCGCVKNARALSGKP